MKKEKDAQVSVDLERDGDDGHSEGAEDEDEEEDITSRTMGSMGRTPIHDDPTGYAQRVWVIRSPEARVSGYVTLKFDVEDTRTIDMNIRGLRLCIFPKHLVSSSSYKSSLRALPTNVDVDRFDSKPNTRT